MARTQLSTFKFDKPPSTMSEQERLDLADKILDQWAEDLKEAPPTPTKYTSGRAGHPRPRAQSVSWVITGDVGNEVGFLMRVDAYLAARTDQYR